MQIEDLLASFEPLFERHIELFGEGECECSNCVTYRNLQKQAQRERQRLRDAESGKPPTEFRSDESDKPPTEFRSDESDKPVDFDGPTGDYPVDDIVWKEQPPVLIRRDVPRSVVQLEPGEVLVIEVDGDPILELFVNEEGGLTWQTPN